jgi:hypothetical protein
VYANTVSRSGLLLKVLLPECCRRQVAQPGLSPLAIVKHVEVLSNLTLGLLACCLALVIDNFVLERSPEALDGRVVEAILAPTHRATMPNWASQQRPVFI